MKIAGIHEKKTELWNKQVETLKSVVKGRRGLRMEA